jgi:N-acetylneuraminic acid mutarotase
MKSRIGIATLTPQWLEVAGRETSVRAAANDPSASALWETYEGIPLPMGRGSHAGGLVSGGRVVVAGGTSWNADRTVKSFLTETLWFDSGIWRSGPSLPVAMAEGAFASDGKSLYVVGGYTAPDQPTAVACRVAAADEKGVLRCEPIAPFPHPIAGNAAVVVEGQLISVGGYVDKKPANLVYALDLNNPAGAWIKRADFPGEPRAYTAVARCGRYVYLLGGLGSTAEEGKLNPLRDVYRYDWRADQWTRMHDLPVPGYCWSAAPPTEQDERHLILAGRADGEIHRDIWLIDVADGSAKQIGETVIQTTCAPLVPGERNALWLLGGEPDSKKNRTPRVTVIRLHDAAAVTGADQKGGGGGDPAEARP